MRKMAKGLRAIAREGLALPIVEAMADAWVDQSQTVAPVDTGQLRARIAVQSLSGTSARASAVVVSDVPYAGFVEFGTARHTPQPYFRKGRDAAEDVVEKVGGRLATEISRALESGGSWNPRRLV